MNNNNLKIDVNTFTKAPIQLIDPIHEICSFVNMPEVNGVFSDDNIGVAGLTQPKKNEYNQRHYDFLCS